MNGPGLDRSYITASQKTGVKHACAVFHRMNENTGGPYLNPFPYPSPQDPNKRVERTPS